MKCDNIMKEFQFKASHICDFAYPDAKPKQNMRRLMVKLSAANKTG